MTMDNLLVIGKIVLWLVFTGAILFALGHIASECKNQKISNAAAKLQEIIYTAVCSTNQTYVNELKKKGEFTIEAHKEAFDKTKNSVLNVLDVATKKVLQKAYNNLDEYIDNLIELTVSDNKEK